MISIALASVLATMAVLPAEKTAPLIATDVVAASPAKVWGAFTTREGQESWQVSHADIDLRVGGLMRTLYAKEGRIGDENTINNLIISYDPERMLSIRIVNPPKNFPFKKASESVWTVIYFEPLAANQTRVTVKMLGWQEDDESQKMRTFFETGNKWVLDKLKSHFAAGSDAAPTK